jgi:phosphoribosylamine--glycine ligase
VAADDSGRLTTAGGRVLDVTALGPTIAEARRRAYEAVARIHWPGMQTRTDNARSATRTDIARSASEHEEETLR